MSEFKKKLSTQFNFLTITIIVTSQKYILNMASNPMSKCSITKYYVFTWFYPSYFMDVTR